MRVPLILKEIEMRTEDADEKKIILNIIEAEENSLSQFLSVHIFYFMLII